MPAPCTGSVLEDGFAWNSASYRSLSEVARAITGTNWNGPLLRPAQQTASRRATPMRTLRCAIYTRVSTEHGLEQEFNSLDNQREASEAYVKSQAQEGWRAPSARYDDGGFSGGSMDRPALQRLLADRLLRLGDASLQHHDQHGAPAWRSVAR
jgi:hypothetical protein